MPRVVSESDVSTAFERWSEGTCVYLCELCSQIFTGLAAFGEHLRRQHDRLSLADYDERHGNAIIQREYVDCKLCRRPVLFDRIKLKAHMIRRHDGFDLASYFRQYVFTCQVGARTLWDLAGDQARQVHIKEEEGPGRIKECLPQSPISAASRAIRHASPSPEPEDIDKRGAAVDAEWYQCLFRCNRCSFRSNEWKQFCAHLREAHAVSTMGQPVSFREQFISSSKQYSCKICCKSLLHDKDILVSHLANFHGMGFQKYLKMPSVKANSQCSAPKSDPQPRRDSKDMKWNRCKFHCTECSFSSDTWLGMSKHLATKHSMHPPTRRGRNSFRNQFVSVKIKFKCPVCAKSILHDRYIINNHFQRRHGTTLTEYFGIDAVGSRKTLFTSRCKFQCDLCDFNCVQWVPMSQHLKLAHGHKSKIRKPIKYASKVVRYRCKLCSKNILHDRKFLQGHLSTKHKMSLTQYLSKTGEKQNATHKSGAQIQAPKKLPNNVTVKTEIPCFSFLGLYVKAWSSQLSDENTTALMENLCLYQCPTCERVMPTFDSVTSHNKSTGHGPGNAAFDPAYVVEARYHKCALCKDYVMSDRTFLSKHLFSRHRSNLTKYKNFLEAEAINGLNETKEDVYTRCSNCMEAFVDFKDLCEHSKQFHDQDLGKLMLPTILLTRTDHG